MQDTSHSFPIQAQRKKKIKTVRKSELDFIEGIGVILKKRLLQKYKSIKNIKSTDIKDLMTVKGINEKIAKKILKKLQYD